MKALYEGYEIEIELTPEYVQILESSHPRNIYELESEIEKEALNSQISDSEARKILGLKENIGSRNIPPIIKGVLSSFNGKLTPVKNEVICFAAFDNRFPTPMLWRTENALDA